MLENEKPIVVDALVAEAEGLRQEGVRFITATGLDLGDRYEVVYHFALGLTVRHLRLNVVKEQTVPSISSVYPAAFLIENEMKELLGVGFRGISIDYGGKLFMVEGAAEHPVAKKLPVGSVGAEVVR